MKTVKLETAQAELAELVTQAAAGEEILIAVNDKPVARLIALPVDLPQVPPERVRLGLLAGQMTVPDDFDAPLPDEILDLFEGKP